MKEHPVSNERYRTVTTVEARTSERQEPGTHPVGTGVGAVGGATAGVVIGVAVGGPVGAMIGAAMGSVAGSLAGKGVAEAVNPTQTQAYGHEDYRPAYGYGWEAAQKHAGRRWADIMDDLRRGWDQARSTSRLSWSEAEPAIHEAWDQASSLQARLQAPAFGVPAIPLQQLNDPVTGRLDAARVADYLSVPLKQLSETLGRNYSTVHKTPTAPAIQETLRSIKRSLVILEDVLGSRSSALAWLNSPNPDLGQRTPIDVLLEGHAQVIEDMLEGALEGIPS